MVGMIWGGSFWICALIIASIGLYSLLLKLPVSIWYRYDIDPSRLTDVKSYNLAAAIVWFSYAFLFIIAGFVGFAGAYKAGLIFSALLIIPGIPMTSIALKQILLYFTVKADADEVTTEDHEKAEEDSEKLEEVEETLETADVTQDTDVIQNSDVIQEEAVTEAAETVEVQ